MDLQYFKYEIKEWWERLGIRPWINQHPRGVIALAASSAVLFP